MSFNFLAVRMTRHSTLRKYTIHKPAETKIQGEADGSSECVYFNCGVLLSKKKISYSGRCRCPSRNQAAQRPNARRVSPAKQDSIFAKSPRKRYKRTAHGIVFSVRIGFHRRLSASADEWCRYPNLHEVRLIPTKRDIAFVEYFDEGSATVAKDALHNYKLDGENKIKVRLYLLFVSV